MEEKKAVHLIIAGKRDFADEAYFRETVDAFCRKNSVLAIFSGTAKGADQMGERYAEEKGIPIRRFLPDWARYGRAAGVLRNKEMVEAAICDGGSGALLAFWDGKSRGTGSIIKLAQEEGLQVQIAWCS